jgi:hypothetical protein
LFLGAVTSHEKRLLPSLWVYVCPSFRLFAEGKSAAKEVVFMTSHIWRRIKICPENLFYNAFRKIAISDY